MKRFLSLALAATLGISLAACSAGHGATGLPMVSGSGISTQAHQRVRHLMSDRATKDIIGSSPLLRVTLGLLDAPLPGGPGTVFNAGILGIDAIDSVGDSWQLIAYQTPQVTNLLSLQTSALNLGTGSLPAGTYPKVELLLDPKTTTATINGTAYPVHFLTPQHPFWDSTQTIESVDIPLNVSGSGGQSVSGTLDFNVFQSADVENGVVNVTPTVVGGLGQPRIHGIVANKAGAPVSNATVVATDSTGHVANVSVTGADGSFEIHGINAGSYTVSVDNTYTTDAGATVTASGNDAGASPSTYVVVGSNDSVNVGTLTD